MRKPESYFFGAWHYASQSLWFKRALYILVLLKTLMWLFYFDLYFGTDAIIEHTLPARGIGQMAFFPAALARPVFAHVSLCLLGAFCLCALFWRRVYFLFDLPIWLLVLNVHNRIYATLTGGDYLLNQFLLFNCFIAAAFPENPGAASQLKKLLHNLAVPALIIQVCLVYLFSGLAKCADETWMKGEAVAAIARIDHFSLGSPQQGGFIRFLNIAASYFAVAYQLCFPLLVWAPRIKKPFIILGIIMHAYIALFMGLPWFAATMVLAYIYFWPRRPLNP